MGPESGGFLGSDRRPDRVDAAMREEDRCRGIVFFFFRAAE